MYGKPAPDSLADTAANVRIRREAHQVLDEVLTALMVREAHGEGCVRVTFKQGTGMEVLKGIEERRRPA